LRGPKLEAPSAESGGNFGRGHQSGGIGSAVSFPVGSFDAFSVLR